MCDTRQSNQHFSCLLVVMKVSDPEICVGGAVTRETCCAVGRPSFLTLVLTGVRGADPGFPVGGRGPIRGRTWTFDTGAFQ